jgi:DNA-binding transcriptional LysR family regulator
MDKLKQIESFASVATRGSLTAAARAEGVAPAIMGRRLDALEERLGVKLLVRTTRRISLTHEGSAFLEDCQRVLADLANAEASVSAGGVKASGHLRITAPAGFGRRHVAPLVPRFRERHAEVTISLNLSDRVVDLAGEGYDCAVRVGDLPDSSLVSVRLADNRRLCVATPRYLQQHGTPRHPNELARFDCLTRDRRPRLHQPAAAACRQAGGGGRGAGWPAKVRPAAGANGAQADGGVRLGQPHRPAARGPRPPGGAGRRDLQPVRDAGLGGHREFYYNDAGVQIATLANSTQCAPAGPQAR